MDVGEDEYESDPEQTKLSLKMRRRAASDDEEEDDHPRGRGMRINSRVSDSESDGQGAAADYDDDKSYIEDELFEQVEEGEEEFGEHYGGDARRLKAPVLRKGLVNLHDNVDQIGENVSESAEGQGQVEKKENDPFSVPTAGAFYMHDDRFRDSVGGKHRQTPGGRNFWELKDAKKWGHDKFEEMSSQERNYKEGRRNTRRGHNRNQARGRNKGENQEHSQQYRPKAPRGKGPKMYQYVPKNTTEPITNDRGPPLKTLDKESHANTSTTSTSEASQFPSTKNGLNYASPPFYPSGSSNKEFKPVAENKTGKNVSDTLGMDKLYINDSMKNTSQQPLLHARNKGRGQSQGQGQTPLGRMIYQPVPPHRQSNRAPLPGQVQSTPGPTNLVESTLELVGKGKGDILMNGMSLFPYGGMATSGGIGGNFGGQNFTGGTPTFLPVMQFAGGQQHGGGIGVGMAFPGYVGQPNGTRNSEMTWLPVLAGSAGGLGAYHAWTAAQASSLPPPPLSKESNINQPDNTVNTDQKSEGANKELGQRQNKGRRYTEMKFGQ